MDQNQKVVLELTRAEAIVLDSLLARIYKDQLLQFRDESEQYVLWTIEGMLDKALYETFDPNYLDILSRAQEEIKNRH